ncbi:unnamed protein product [Agarophyton chilense]|eukprot:gb/GEZJ01001808.1/.p1 GENE.gb/GEZJ01001808.1/~~gb/GEZJ01001808.1/.p1  ORF type:complete len:505 (+),score=101.58 gb/GEZJ01001808.1/:490-2004(+)
MSNVIEDVFGSDWGSDIELRNEISDAIKQSDGKEAKTAGKPAAKAAAQKKKASPSRAHSDSEPDIQPSKGAEAVGSDSDHRPTSSRRRSSSKRDESPIPSRRSSGKNPDEEEHNSDARSDEVASSDEDREAERRRRREKKRRISRESSRKAKRAKKEKRAAPELEGDSEQDQEQHEDEVQARPGRKRKRAQSKREEEEQGQEPEPEPKPEKPKTEFERVMDDAKALRRPRAKEVDGLAVTDDCLAFMEKMMKARDDDMRAYRSNKPALGKLKMLREVELMIMKTSHREIFLDNMLLTVIKKWLDPMPDGTLPNLAIRQSLLQILTDMPVDNDWIERLESSQGLGKVIHFLATKDTNAPNRRMAEKLMMKWSRVVYQNNANFHDLLEEYARPDNGNRIPTEGVAAERRNALNQLRTFKSSRQKLESIKPFPGKERAQVLAAVPRPSPMLYTTLAESEAVNHKAVRGGRVAKAMNRKVSKTIMDLRRNNKRGSARASRPSINGRDR